jgi:hypothetical protein
MQSPLSNSNAYAPFAETSVAEHTKQKSNTRQTEQII